MSGQISVWQVGAADPPKRLGSNQLSFERQLEEWIEQDPALLESGLTIVGRQIPLEGGTLDLLAIDPQGRWVLIEIKRERLRRDVIAQAIDYASCLDQMPFAEVQSKCDAYLCKCGRAGLADLLRESGAPASEQEGSREIIVYLVGVGRDPGLDRMVSYLARSSGLVIRVVTFEVFTGPADSLIMVRELHEAGHEIEEAPRATQSWALDDLLSRARDAGVGDIIEPLHRTALDVGLVPRTYSGSIRYAPLENRTRCIFTVWVTPEKRYPSAVRVWFAADNFEQFYGITEEQFREALGEPGYQIVKAKDADRLATVIRALLARKDEASSA